MKTISEDTGLLKQLSAQPRPWKADKFGELQDPTGKAVTASSFGLGVGSKHQWPHAAANTEYILNAVNSHDDLLAACQAAIDDIDSRDYGTNNAISDATLHKMIDALEKATKGTA